MSTFRPGFLVLLFLIIPIFTTACSSDGTDGSNGFNSLVKVVDEAPDASCALGRRRIEVGLDVNRNQVLDNDEVQHTEYICPEYASPFDGLVFTENASTDSMRELYAAWPMAGATLKLAAPRYSNMTIDNMVLSPDKSHVAYFIKGLRQYFIADLLHPYTEPVALTEGLAGTDRAGHFAWSPDGRFVAFTVGSDPRGETLLFSALADGSGVSQLTPIDPPAWANVHEMAWSPDSQYLAFTYDLKQDLVFQLYTVKPDGSNMTPVSVDLVPVHPSIDWAPDGSRIAYQDLHQQYLYTALPTGGTPVTVAGPTVSGGSIHHAYWAPDSKYLAFYGDYDVVNQFDIYTTLPDKANVLRINEPLVAGETVVSTVQSFPGWSHDGSLLAYIADEAQDEVHELFVATPEANRVRVSAVEGDVNAVSWSPTALQLAFIANENELYLVDANGANHRNIVTVTPYFSYFGWSPNGLYLTYMEPNKLISGETLSEIFIYDVKQNTSVSVSPDVDGGYWANYYPGIQWSPDSSMLAFKITYPHPDHDNTAAFMELYSVFADGSGLQNLTVQEKPDSIDFNRINLGVDRIYFQGDYLTHYFLSL